MKRINKFHIINIKMEGFKKFKEPYSIEFDRFTCISGGNGQGKSTIADAIAYAFCGTPFWGEKSCDRLLNSESREMYVEEQQADHSSLAVTSIYLSQNKAKASEELKKVDIISGKKS